MQAYICLFVSQKFVPSAIFDTWEIPGNKQAMFDYSSSLIFSPWTWKGIAAPCFREIINNLEMISSQELACSWASCKYPSILYKELEHLWVLITTKGSSPNPIAKATLTLLDEWWYWRELWWAKAKDHKTLPKKCSLFERIWGWEELYWV